MKKYIQIIWFFSFLFLSVLIFFMVSDANKNTKNEKIEDEETLPTESDQGIYSEDILWENIKYQSVMIKGDNLYGSGTIYQIDEDYIYVVSNDHLAIYVVNPMIIFYDGTSVEAVNTINSEQLDMGILQVDIDQVPSELIDALGDGRLNFEEDIYLDLQVYSLGYADGSGSSKVKGSVLAVDEYHLEFHAFMIRCSGNVMPGMSGAGVYDYHGNYLGMISGEKDEEFVFLPVYIMREEEFFGGNDNDEN